MLPQTAPQLPNLDVAFEMHPRQRSGATIMTKSHGGRSAFDCSWRCYRTRYERRAHRVRCQEPFQNSPPEMGNLETLERISQGIKSMNLKRLYMAMTLATLNGNKLTLAGAGMPPPLIYRADENSVEEILLEGMPLGGFIGAEREKASLNSRAVIPSCLSDGLPEMLNPETKC